MATGGNHMRHPCPRFQTQVSKKKKDTWRKTAYLCWALPYIDRIHMVSHTQAIFYSASPSPSFRFRPYSGCPFAYLRCFRHVHMLFVYRAHATHSFPSRQLYCYNCIREARSTVGLRSLTHGDARQEQLIVRRPASFRAITQMSSCSSSPLPSVLSGQGSILLGS